MSISADLRTQIRQRAGFACEYCGVEEIDVGGELTIDHFQPRTHEGGDELENLIYCCVRCNQYKLDYWPIAVTDQALWNPRRESCSLHFVELEEGFLHPLTPTGVFTLQRLRLNRPPLVAYRSRKRQQVSERQLLTEYGELVVVLGKLHQQLSGVIEEQQKLLKEQQALLVQLLERT
jgi:hypothetical protein